MLWDREGDLHFEIQSEERYLLHLLQDCDCLADVSRQWQEKFGLSLGNRQIKEFVEQLRAHGLVEECVLAGECVEAVGAGASALESSDHRPLLNAFFDLLAALWGWVLHPLTLVPAGLLVAVGMNVLARHWSDIRQDLGSVFYEYPFMPLMIASFAQTIVLLNLPHALFVGMAARRIGGRVESFGVMLWRGIVPLLHVNTGVSLWLADDRQRRRFLCAEFLFPLVIGSFYLCCWSLAGDHPVARKFFAFMVFPSLLGFLLLQCNVFAFHSSYWMLCWWLRDWRLQERALSETRAWIAMRRSPEALTSRERFWLRLYGLGYYGGRVAMDCALMFGLIFYVIANRHPRDPTIFAFAGVVFIAVVQGWSLERWLMPAWLGRLMRGGGSWVLRWSLRAAVVAAIIACGFIPYTHEVGGDFRLVPAHEYSIRAQIPAEIAEIRIRAGDRVSTNSVIAVLHARDQRNNVETTKHQLAGARAKLDLALAGFRKEQVQRAIEEAEMYRARLNYWQREHGRIEKLYEQKQASAAQLDNTRYELESAQRLLAAAEEKFGMLNKGTREEEIREAQAEVDRLEALLKHYEIELNLAEIAAPDDGHLVAIRVPARPGQYVNPGDLIAVLHDVSDLRAEIFASEDAAVFVKQGQETKLRMPGFHEGELIRARIDEKSVSAIHRDEVDIDPYRSDREFLSKARMTRQDDRYVRIYADLENRPPDLLPYMTGYARIVIKNDVLWRALARPVVRFARTEIWSWLP
jgi:multidrug efflux pump subunit AcrA (membrane-fusion protein)